MNVKMKGMEKIISIILCFSMLFSLFPPLVYGEDTFNNNEELFGIESESTTEQSYLLTSSNVVGYIPENSDDLMDDLGSDCIIADINSISTYSLRRSNVVELDVSGLSDSVLDVLHFVEDSNAISEEMQILDVSDYSNKSKEVLGNAIAAYQDYYDSEEERVVVEIFEDLEVIDGVISFEVGSFSIFAVGDFNITTYEFYVDGNLHNIQILIGDEDDEDILVSPETPYKDGSEFLGWQIEGSSEILEFGVTSVTESTIIKCNAVFDEVSYVYFYYEAKENADILETLSGKAGDVIYTEHIDYPLSLDKHIVSWHTDIECTSPDVTEVTLTDEDIILYPKVEKGYWVTFYTEGGSYIDPMFYTKNETIIQPADPVREGYLFIGWFDENGNEFEFNNQIVTESVKLTAKYDAQVVNYTVQIVMQDADIPDQYNSVLGGMFTKQGLCGDTVKSTDIPISELDTIISGLSSTSYFKSKLKYFYYSDSKNSTEEIELESDGSSVLYIYYDRYEVEINYYLSYSDETPWLTQKGLYDELTPTEHWPTPSESEYSNFGDWESSSNVYPSWTGRFRFEFIWDDVEEKYYFNVYATKGSETKHILYSWVQGINPDGTVPDVGIHIDNLPAQPLLGQYHPNTSGNDSSVYEDNWGDIEFETDDVTNNGTWVLYATQEIPSNISSEYATLSYSGEWYEGFKAVAVGFDLYHKNSGETTDYRVDDFSHRTWESYIAYLTKSGTKWVEAGKPSDSAYITKGSTPFYYLESDEWYAITSPVKLAKLFGNTHMRFLRNHYNLQFFNGEDKVASFDEVYFETPLGLDKFKNVQKSLTPPAGYVFDGWFTSPTLTEDTRFNLDTNTMPATDLILYAKFKSIKIEVDVHVTIDGVDEIIEGFNGFTVKYGNIVNKDEVDALKDSVNIPTGAIWYGWYEKINVGGGKELLVPFNFDKQLVTDVVLYPFYSYMTPVNVTYDLNGGTGTAPVDNFNYALGRGAVVLDNKNVIPPDGKVFVCWNTESDGSGKSYYPADIAIVTEDKMPLYAIYGDKDTDIEVGLIYVNEEGSEEVVKEYSSLENVTILDESIFSNIPQYKVLKEWNTEVDGSGVSYSVNDKIMLTGKDNKLYAIWEFGPEYKIIINYVNRLNSEEKSFTYQGVNNAVLQDESVFVNPVDSKYVFCNWNTKADGSGVSYNVGDTVTHVGKINIYAIWGINPAYRIAVTYVNPLNAEEKELEYFGVETAVLEDSSIFDEQVASKYIFKGWNTEEDGSGEVYYAKDVVTPNTEMKLYAMWQERTYSPTRYNYTVYYKDTDGNEIAKKQVFTADLNKVVTVEAKDIEGYICKDSEKSLKITRNSNDNVIIFIYDKEGFKLPEHKYLDYDLDHKHYIVGYEDGTVRPNNNITRAESATIFYRLLKESVQKEYSTIENDFSDVNVNNWFNTSVSTLTRLGLINGYSDGTFKPNQYITRAEFVSLMVAFFEAEDIEYQNIFTDISESNWYYRPILIGVNKGFIAGYPDGTFKPNQYITRAEACKIVNSVLCRKPIKSGLYENLKVWPDLDKNAWYYLDVMEATHHHIAEYINENETWNNFS